MLGCGSHGYSESHTRVHRHDGIQSQRSVSLRDLMSAIFSVWRIETGDSWDQILRINMYGCATFPLVIPWWEIFKGGTGRERHQDRRRGSRPPVYRRGRNGHLCTHHFTVIFGGLVLQSVLIGIIAISFEVSVARFDGKRLTDID